MVKFIKFMIKKIKFYFISKTKKVSIGRGCNISFNSVLEGRNTINNETNFSGKLGYASYLGEKCNINGLIGRYCSIGSNVSTVAGKHPTSGFVSTHPAFFSLRKQAGFTYVNRQLFDEFDYADKKNFYSVIIGNDVWIGKGVTILEGIKIGDGAILGTGAIVTKDVEPYAIYAGIPAKKIGQRFEDKVIALLLEIQWWTKGEKWVQEHAEFFSEVNSFLEIFKKKYS
jgi:acetyltransferase-like isoleucine patch superfamily enzyme